MRTIDNFGLKAKVSADLENRDTTVASMKAGMIRRDCLHSVLDGPIPVRCNAMADR
jgi:hypothetical protein